ncbi:MAG TPA: ATP-grasp domain-containing protein, partial [Candidatus Sumerlaeota bacterium]|nr:ATP-grasp domain-containing protein [Candidatus Sumerlaeota bacterium]
LSDHVIATIRRATHQLARALKVKGLMNVQYAVRDEEVYVLEVNPRASRTVPYVSKAIGQPIAQYAARLMVGRTLREIGFTEEPRIHFYAVKEAVLPFNKFPGCTVILGPEMRSTGEVMGVDADYAMAFAKSQLAAGSKLPLDGRIFVSVNDYDKRQFLPIARKLVELGFEFLCTAGTHRFLSDNGVASRQVEKLSEGRPNIQDLVMNNEVGMIVNTFSGDKARHDEKMIRTLAIRYELPLFTTIAAARAVAQAIAALKVKQLEVKSLQEYHAELRARPS